MGSKTGKKLKRIAALLVLGQLLAFGACKPPKREAERNPIPEYAIGELEERRKKEEEEDDESNDQPGGGPSKGQKPG
ncbi:MAG: hypothetical protein ACQEVA_11425 [Myxococcota bacterium]